MKCRVCRGPAVIDVRRHNANFCAEHFLRLCRDQVARAIGDHEMLNPGDRVLVAVSGGKDSLAVWDILVELGYRADGLYLGLGIDGYSPESEAFARAFATSGTLPARPSGFRAVPAGCPSDTYSTRLPGGVPTTPWPPATTWTTRRRCCSATCSGGRAST